MPRTLSKYIFLRWLSPTAGGVLFYGGLLLANELLGLSKEVFNLGASFKWLLPLTLLAIPETMMMVLPMAAVLGGILGTQHLSEDSELVASQGLGIGYKALFKPYLALGTLLIGLAGANAHFMVPAVNHLQSELRSQMIEDARTRFLRTGQSPRFPPGTSGESLWMDPNGEVHLMDVRPTSVQHMVAQGISYSIHSQDDGSNLLDIQLKNLAGSLFQLQSQSVVNLHQESQDLRFHIPGNSKLLTPTPLRYLSSAQILGLNTPPAKVELSRRIALPIASAALLLVGIALGLGHPRFQSGGSFLKSLAVVLIYYLLNIFLENHILQSSQTAFFISLLLPWVFLMVGAWWLREKLRPHHSNPIFEWIKSQFIRYFQRGSRLLFSWLSLLRSGLSGIPSPELAKGWSGAILNRWSTKLWLGSWLGTVGSLLALDFLIEYATLAGDLSKNHGSVVLFLEYWIFNLPSFLAVALPISFLLGTLLALAQASQTSEWVALKAGGFSLAQWIWKARFAWLGVLAFTFILQVWLAPLAYLNNSRAYNKILNRPDQPLADAHWLYLGTTGVLWSQQGETRWGFPLKPPHQAPILLRWRAGEANSMGLPWGGTRLVSGPPASQLFPEASLRVPTHTDMTGTMDLLKWQRWAPDPGRATLMWNRLLSWLAGPCLVLAMLSWAFPSPRAGRGQSLGKGLVAGLLFLGLQGIFLGAANSGEIPAPIGVLAPMLLFAGFGLKRLRHLKT